MEIKKIKIVDPYSTKCFHEVFNTSLIDIASKLSKSVKVIMGKGAIKSVIHTLRHNHINLHSFIELKSYHTVEGDSRKDAFFRTLVGSLYAIKEYFTCNKNELLIYNYTNSLTFPFILLLNRFLGKTVIFVMHGELEWQIKRIKRTSISRLYRFMHKVGFNFFLKKSNAFILVLGESIKSNLIMLFPNIQSNIISINHPYYFPEKTENNVDCTKSLTRILSIGTIGTLNASKGLMDVYRLTNVFSEEIKSGKLEIRVIGRVEDRDTNLLKLAHIVNNGHPLSIEKYNEEIDRLNFILFCYPVESYTLTASGAIMDAISHDKPIITYHNDYFNMILNDSSPGYFANDFNDIVCIIKDLLNGKTIPHSYEIARKRISILENMYQLKKQLELNNIYFI